MGDLLSFCILYIFCNFPHTSGYQRLSHSVEGVISVPGYSNS